MQETENKSKKKILELNSVYAGYNGHFVLEDISLTVYENDFIGVIGANGSGKTTLLKVILGLLQPARGELNFFMKNGGASHKKNIGYMPQASMFDKKFPIRVIDVVLSGLISKVGVFRQFSKRHKVKAEEILAGMDALHLKDKAIGELSGGQMQRVFLARALVSSPGLLVLDEPNTFVDKHFEENFYEILKELNKEMAIILVSHDLGMINSYVKTIACMDRHLHYHDSSEITAELLDSYNCPIDLITHGELPHRVLKSHSDCLKCGKRLWPGEEG
ncbi:MAG: ABC transporter ATP-binding protein [bacterium]|nr:ABC transporter ATP-binding protein [bacterium]